MWFRKQQYPCQPGCLAPKRRRKAISPPSPQYLYIPLSGGGAITLDERTALAGIPERAWEYQLGSRSALEWVLDQYKERKPRDPTIREKFNTYRFSDHKEEVIDLLRQVCTVSVATMEIVESRVTPVSGPGKGD